MYRAVRRSFPFAVLPPLKTLLEAQRDLTRAMEKKTGRIIPWVFWHDDGQPIKDFYGAWRAACERAAHDGKGALRVLARPHLIGRIAHDFQRTAVRNLVRAGVSRHVAMLLCGHKTTSVFLRYDITNEADLRAGVEKLATHLTATEAPGQSEAPRKNADNLRTIDATRESQRTA